jgi:putative sigma-54 modulation protein
MRVVLTGRHVTITPTLRALVDRRLLKLERPLGEALVSVQVGLRQEKKSRVVEIVAHLRGDHMLHGKGSATAWATAVGEAVTKVVQQGQKVKGKYQRRKRHATAGKTVAAQRVAAAEPVKAEGPRIVRAPPYGGKPMTVEEAAREADGSREGVVVFRNAGTNAVNVIYRRRNGDLGLIEPDV